MTTWLGVAGRGDRTASAREVRTRAAQIGLDLAMRWGSGGGKALVFYRRADERAVIGPLTLV
jgi:hypothetical protein